MAEMKNNKWIARLLALCLISFASWFAGQVWSQQKDIMETNTEQNASILVLQTHIVSIDKSLMGIERAMREDTIRERQRDSILQDLALKVDFIFEGR